MNPKRLGFQSIEVHFGTFDYRLFVIIGAPDNVLKYARWKMDNPMIGLGLDIRNQRGLCFVKSGWMPLLWLPRKPRSAADIGVLAHELIHAITVMLVDWVGLKLSDDTDEVFAHAMGYAVTEILTKLK